MYSYGVRVDIYMYFIHLHSPQIIVFLCADIDDLIDVKCELLDVSHNWKGVGEALRLKPALLSRIQANHPTDVIACLTETLTEWLNKSYNTSRFGPPSWKLLVAAVANPAGGNDGALAEQIAQKYNGKCNKLSCTHNPCLVGKQSEPT